MKRYFNTSGPNNPQEHYTLMRSDLVAKGMDLVYKKRYFTIWAPRQTGKSTYFLLLKEELEREGYKVIHISVEGYKNITAQAFLKELAEKFSILSNRKIVFKNFADFVLYVSGIDTSKCVFIIDEIEGLNPEFFGEFLHGIRNLYHSRSKHCLKSVVLVGISNIVGVVEDAASPFNIADNISIPYFTNKETAELLAQHEKETGQSFHESVKSKISQTTANQPGLVNAFAKKLAEDYSAKQVLSFNDYLKVEHWFVWEAIDKNIANIVNKARKFRPFVEQLLFQENKILFDIDREAIKVLHTNGIIKKGEDNHVEFWVPLYRKRLHKTFYPYTNGEANRIQRNLIVSDYYLEDGSLNLHKLIANYKKYTQKRSFKYFREKDKNGNYLSIKEAALQYSFETYIHAFLQEAEGRSYWEPHTGLGRSDLLIYLDGREYIIESKIYHSFNRFQKGKKQLAYYCQKNGLSEGYYLVFIANTVKRHSKIKEEQEVFDGVTVHSYLVDYDEKADF